MELVLPAVAGASGLLATGAVVFRKIRPYFAVRVNCWFCNTDNKVAYRQKDSFVCSHCKQYNGFNEDGDYNCDLPAQYCESLNSPPCRVQPFTRHRAGATIEHTPGLSLGNGLCQTCNLYQAMKVKALSEFEPSHPDKYDEEVEVYEQRLERLYGGLCRACNQTLKCTLGEQDSWLKPKLIHWRLMQSTLIKDLLTPLHNGLSRRSHILSTALRLVCIFAAFVMVLSAVLTRLQVLQAARGGAVAHSAVLATGNTTETSSKVVTENSTDTTPQSMVQVLCLEWVSDHWPVVLDWSSVLHAHEAGAAVLMLALLLTAIMVAGRSLLKAWDAAGCLLLVLQLALCSWQEALLQLVPQYLEYAKLWMCSCVCVVVALGLVARPPAPVVPRKEGRRRRHDWSQDSLLSDSSLNSSQDCTTNSNLRAFSPVVSTVAPSLVSTASLLNTTSTPLSTPVPRAGMHNSFMGANGNPFLPRNSLVGKGAGTASLATNPFGGKFNLKPRHAGESLDTSLGGLNLGTAPNSPAVLNARNAFIQRGRNTVNGINLRPDVPQSSLPSQNINGIAQSSWVAGGYWGSPSKANRAAAAAGLSNVAQLQQHVQANEQEQFPLSRSSSQSSGFVSHGSGSQVMNEARAGPSHRGAPLLAHLDNDRASVESEPAFVWNYESCETSSQGSQTIDDLDFLRRRNVPSSNMAASDGRSVLSSATASASQYSSAVASSVLPPQQMWQMQQCRSRSPFEDMQTMRALSRLSQHDISDDDLSLLSRRSLDILSKPAANSPVSYRDPWVAFIFGMSVMANGILAFVLYKNGTFAQLLNV